MLESVCAQKTLHPLEQRQQQQQRGEEGRDRKKKNKKKSLPEPFCARRPGAAPAVAAGRSQRGRRGRGAPVRAGPGGRESCAFPSAPGSRGERPGREQWGGGGAAPGAAGRGAEGGPVRPEPGGAPNNEAPAGEFPGTGGSGEGGGSPNPGSAAPAPPGAAAAAAARGGQRRGTARPGEPQRAGIAPLRGGGAGRARQRRTRSVGGWGLPAPPPRRRSALDCKPVPGRGADGKCRANVIGRGGGGAGGGNGGSPQRAAAARSPPAPPRGQVHGGGGRGAPPPSPPPFLPPIPSRRCRRPLEDGGCAGWDGGGGARLRAGAARHPHPGGVGARGRGGCPGAAARSPGGCGSGRAPRRAPHGACALPAARRGWAARC